MASGPDPGTQHEAFEEPFRMPPPPGMTEEDYELHSYRIRPSGQPPAVEFYDVYKSFGRAHILQGLDFELPEGQISMILGPSGTGKSVCIKHMVGLLFPDRGDVLVHGNSVSYMTDDELAEMRKRFGLLFQDGALFGSMNIFDNVAFPLRQHTDKPEEEVQEIVRKQLDRVGLLPAAWRLPHELSGGMRKRAGFARALVLDPDIVLFDEPDSGLDPVRTSLLGTLIQDIHEVHMEAAEDRGAEHMPCYCLITHNIDLAQNVADYLCVLWKGRLVEAGPKDELVGSENPFLRQFLVGESVGPLAME